MPALAIRNTPRKHAKQVQAVAAVAASLLLAGVACAQPWGWTRLELQNAPSPRYECLLAGDRPELDPGGGNPDRAGVLFGGLDANGELGDVWVWRARQAGQPQWEFLPQIGSGSGTPGTRSNASIAAEGSGTFLVTGGLSAGVPRADCWRLTTNQQSSAVWTQITTLPQPRWNHASVVLLRSQITVVGGASGLSPGSPVLADPLTSISNGVTFSPWTWSGNPADAFLIPNERRWVMSMVPFLNVGQANPTAIMPFGDRRATLGDPYLPYNFTNTLSPPSGVNPFYSWSVLDLPMTPRSNYAIASRRVPGQAVAQVVLFGGDLGTYPAPTSLFGDTWILDPVAGSWSQVQGVGPSPRRARNHLFFDVSRNCTSSSAGTTATSWATPGSSPEKPSSGPNSPPPPPAPAPRPSSPSVPAAGRSPAPGSGNPSMWWGAVSPGPSSTASTWTRSPTSPCSPRPGRPPARSR